MTSVTMTSVLHIATLDRGGPAGSNKRRRVDGLANQRPIPSPKPPTTPTRQCASGGPGTDVGQNRSNAYVSVDRDRWDVRCPRKIHGSVAAECSRTSALQGKQAERPAPPSPRTALLLKVRGLAPSLTGRAGGGLTTPPSLYNACLVNS